MAATQQNRDPASPPPVPRGPEDCSIYAVGDIHGRFDLLRRLLDLVAEDAAGAPARRHRLVFLGDYVDRGPDSRDVVEMMVQGPPPGFDAVHLKGNHEDMMLEFLDHGGDGDFWMVNGGDTTLHSYGVGLFDPPFADHRRHRLRQDLADALPPHHLAFLRRLVNFHIAGDYLFVHAGLRPGVPLAEQVERDMIWIRDTFLDSGESFGRMVVHGHSISLDPEVRANRVGIDTGAYRSGRLTCLVIDGEVRRFLST